MWLPRTFGILPKSKVCISSWVHVCSSRGHRSADLEGDCGYHCGYWNFPSAVGYAIWNYTLLLAQDSLYLSVCARDHSEATEHRICVRRAIASLVSIARTCCLYKVALRALPLSRCCWLHKPSACARGSDTTRSAEPFTLSQLSKTSKHTVRITDPPLTSRAYPPGRSDVPGSTAVGGCSGKSLSFRREVNPGWLIDK